MSVKTKKVTIENAEITSTELGVCEALDLLADMIPAGAPAQGSLAEGRSNMGEAVGMFVREFTGGRLVHHLSRLLACTTVVVRDEKVKVELIDSREKINDAFRGRQRLLAPAVKLALEVSFTDFLEGLKLAGLKIQMPSLSGASTPSTTATG